MPPTKKSSVALPIASMPMMMASLPMAAQVPQMPTASTLSPVAQMEAQMKAMKEYMSAMEKAMKGKKEKKPRTPKDPSAPKKEMPAGTKLWNLYVESVRGEVNEYLRAQNPQMVAQNPDWKPFSYKDAMQEASRRRELGDPKAPQKAVPKPKAVAAVSSVPLNMALPSFMGVAPVAPVAAEKKRIVKKTVAAPVPAPTLTMPAFTLPFNIPSMPAATPAIAETEEEEEESLEEIEIDGKLYAMSSKNECWLMTEEGDRGAWAGIYNPATNTIEESEEPDY
jgi:hypothetical protein